MMSLETRTSRSCKSFARARYASTVNRVGVAVGSGVAVGRGVGVAVGRGVGVAVGCGVAVGWGVHVGAGVQVGTGVAVAVGCEVAVGCGAGVAVGCGVGVGCGVHVGTGVHVGAGVGWDSLTMAWTVAPRSGAGVGSVELHAATNNKAASATPATVNRPKPLGSTGASAPTR